MIYFYYLLEIINSCDRPFFESTSSVETTTSSPVIKDRTSVETTNSSRVILVRQATPEEVNTKITRSLLNSLNSLPENFVFSPFSIYSALTSLRAILEKSVSLQKIDEKEFHSSTILYINSNNKEDILKNKNIMNTLDKVYGEGTSVTKLNDFVKSTTKGLVELGLQDSHLDSPLILINAVYFKGNWKYNFTSKKVNFADKEVDGLSRTFQKNEIKYHENDDWVFLEFPYENENLKAQIFMHKNSKFKKYPENLLESEKFQEKISVELPKFKIEYELKSHIITKSFPDLFDIKNYKKFFNEYSIKGNNGRDLEVIHKAFIEIDETGTEAAAVTAVIQKKSAFPKPKILKVIIEKPFWFVLKKEETSLFTTYIQDL